jgi:hypothetical protein
LRAALSVLVFAVFISVSTEDASAGPPPITVTNADDPGNGICNEQCTLREAIDVANGTVGADTIQFNIGTGTPVIFIGAPLVISDPVVVIGAGPADRVELRGPGGPFDANFNGLKLTAGAAGTQLHDLVINSFPGWGIWIDAGSVKVRGSRIGTDATGSVDMGNGAGIIVMGSGAEIGFPTGTTPGGACTGGCNLISGNNGYGIALETTATNAVIKSNYVGTDVSGNAAIRNDYYGIFTNGASGLTLGGAGAGEGNVVSGNFQVGVEVNGPSAQIQGNRIGTNSAGTAAIANGQFGLSLRAATNAVAGPDNLVSGNTMDGVLVVQTTGAQVKGNLIGVAADGVTPLPNGLDGVYVVNASDNTIGDPTGVDVNTIAYNGGFGVSVEKEATGNWITRNSIYSNASLGIGLDIDGVTANDDGDGDDGPNNLQNFPVLTGVTLASGMIQINGTLNSAANTEYGLEFFANDTCDASGHGEGRAFVGADSVTTNGLGNGVFSSTSPSEVLDGSFITAVAWADSGGHTSEFSACIVVPEPGSVAMLVTAITVLAGLKGMTGFESRGRSESGS